MKRPTPQRTGGQGKPEERPEERRRVSRRRWLLLSRTISVLSPHHSAFQPSPGGNLILLGSVENPRGIGQGNVLSRRGAGECGEHLVCQRRPTGAKLRPYPSDNKPREPGPGKDIRDSRSLVRLSRKLQTRCMAGSPTAGRSGSRSQ